MKRVVLAVVILAVIITAGVLETVWVDKVFDELGSRLESLEIDIKAKSDEALKKINDLDAWWEERRKWLELFTYQPDIRAFSVALGETVGSIECGDFDNAMSKCQSLMTMADNIHRILDFNLEDII